MSRTAYVEEARVLAALRAVVADFEADLAAMPGIRPLPADTLRDAAHAALVAIDEHLSLMHRAAPVITVGRTGTTLAERAETLRTALEEYDR